MSEQLPKDERLDLSCDCFGDNEALWGPVCSDYDESDIGFCMNCGHMKVCHEHQ